MGRRILIARDFHPAQIDATTTVAATVGQLREAGMGNLLRRHLLRYDEAGVLVQSLDPAHLSLKTSAALRLLSRGSAYFEDPHGLRSSVSWGLMGKLAVRVARDRMLAPWLLRQTEREVRHWESRIDDRPRLTYHRRGMPIYLRTDLVFGVRAGGSVGHIAGVLNQLDDLVGSALFLTSDAMPGIRPQISTTVIRSDERFRHCSELSSMNYQQTFFREAQKALGSRQPALVYQRYSANNFCGLKLARQRNVPLVLEYNGSEVWVSRHWGNPRQHEALTERIELLNVRGADLVVVVSQPMREELISRGVERDRILVNPNGVEAEVYHPDVDGTAVRDRYGLHGKCVLGFIGTFGRWHGADVLAQAFGRLLQQRPAERERLRLLLVGDGNLMPQVREALERTGASHAAVLTGLVPQAEGPAHLAACDVLVSPHVPNPDGTPFFGSPTKLFEYMAMGRGIVASDLDQIGQVLAHEKNAWLVEPGDVDDLAAGLGRLIDDVNLRDQLGAAARREAVARYTWRQHTERILHRLEGVIGMDRTASARIAA
jgi:glycosyltransferase involved in cell wall biosynthesis